MRQLRLFDWEPGEIPLEETQPRVRPHATRSKVEPLSQLPLFTDKIQILGELDLALENADFAEATRLRSELEARHGRSAVPGGLGFLDELGPDFWERPFDVRQRLSAWRSIDEELQRQPNRRRRLRQGFFSRLLAAWSSEELVESQPSCLPALVNTLGDWDRTAEARRLVRDALLSGRPSGPTDFDDPVLSDLLSEDLEPRWLASLGAIRRLWPLPRPAAEDVEAFVQEVSGPEPSADSQRALAFWRSLQVAQLRGRIPENILHEARKRMKKLQPTLHAEYMGHSV